MKCSFYFTFLFQIKYGLNISIVFRCKRQCIDSRSNETKEMILERFNVIGNGQEQDLYLAGCIQANDVKRRRPSIADSDKQRRCHYYYKVTVIGLSYNIDLFEVEAGVHQGALLNPLLFIVVLEAWSRGF